jgi:hypothetical protein
VNVTSPLRTTVNSPPPGPRVRTATASAFASGAGTAPDASAWPIPAGELQARGRAHRLDRRVHVLPDRDGHAPALAGRRTVGQGNVVEDDLLGRVREFLERLEPDDVRFLVRGHRGVAEFFEHDAVAADGDDGRREGDARGAEPIAQLLADPLRGLERQRRRAAFGLRPGPRDGLFDLRAR